MKTIVLNRFNYEKILRKHFNKSIYLDSEQQRSNEFFIDPSKLFDLIENCISVGTRPRSRHFYEARLQIAEPETVNDTLKSVDTREMRLDTEVSF